VGRSVFYSAWSKVCAHCNLLYVFTRLSSQLESSDRWRTNMAAKSRATLIIEMQMLAHVCLLNLCLDDEEFLED
jgi:hypothetical protein